MNWIYTTEGYTTCAAAQRPRPAGHRRRPWVASRLENYLGKGEMAMMAVLGGTSAAVHACFLPDMVLGQVPTSEPATGEAA